MSLWAQAQIKSLLARVDALEKRVLEIESKPEFPDPVNTRTFDLAKLTEEYATKFGKPPHHRMKPETIMEALSGK